MWKRNTFFEDMSIFFKVQQSIDITTTSEIGQAEKEYTDRQKDRLRINRQINRHSGQTCKIDRNRMNTHKWKNTVDKQKDTSTNKNTYVDGKQAKGKQTGLRTQLTICQKPLAGTKGNICPTNQYNIAHPVWCIKITLSGRWECMHPRTWYYFSINGPGEEVRWSSALERAWWPPLIRTLHFCQQ